MQRGLRMGTHTAELATAGSSNESNVRSAVGLPGLVMMAANLFVRRAGERTAAAAGVESPSTRRAESSVAWRSAHPARPTTLSGKHARIAGSCLGVSAGRPNKASMNRCATGAATGTTRPAACAADIGRWNDATPRNVRCVASARPTNRCGMLVQSVGHMFRVAARHPAPSVRCRIAYGAG